MLLRKVGAVGLILLICVAPTTAQGSRKGKGHRRMPPKPNLSGTWVMDRSKSYIHDVKGRRERPEPETLTIEHQEPEVKITRTIRLNSGRERTDKLVYYADGRGETNPPIIGNGRDESKTIWEGARLFIRGTHHLGDAGSSVDVDFTESWELSADGKALKQTARYASPLVDDTTRVFKLVK